jgi:hypothetical protein
MERGSIIRETGVAMTTASNTGTMKDRSRLVSSMISTIAEMNSGKPVSWGYLKPDFRTFAGISKDDIAAPATLLPGDCVC